jgi:DNA-binding NarL/FixJ family response regulator
MKLPTATSTLVLLVDDSAQVRADLRAAFALCQGIDIAGEASDGEEAVIREAALSPDVVLMDLAMPGVDGLEASRRIKARRPGCRIVALTVHAGEEERGRASQAGIDAFVVKGAPLEELLRAIRG